MKPGRTWTSISSYGSPYISFQAFTWDRPKNELRAVYFILSLVHVDYVNYHVVIFMAHLHLNELSLKCDMWLNKITYLLDVVSVADPTRTTRVIFVPVRDCTVLMQNGHESQTGSINSIFLRTAPLFSLFFSKIRTLL